MKGDILLASLPTSKGHVPSDLEVKQGCLDVLERMLNVFVFLSGENVAVMIHLLHLIRIPLFTVPILVFIRLGNSICRNVWHRLLLKKIGTLGKSFFKELIACLSESKMVKNKFRRILKGWLNWIMKHFQ